MRSQRSFLAIIGAGALAAASAAAFVQEPATPRPSPSPAADKSQTPSFPAQVEQVIVDVVVVDKKGVPIPSLNQADFTVLEDGKPQELQSFERVVLPERPPQPNPTPPPKISINTDEDVKTGRTFVIVFDDIHMAPFQAHRAKGAVSEFLKSGVQEGDRVTLLATGGAAWWSTRMLDGRGELLALLKRLEGRNIPDMSPERMSDYEAMRIHVYHDTQVADRVARRYATFGVNPSSQNQNQSQNQITGSGADGDPMVMGKASEVYYQAVTKNRITLEVVERALGAMVGTKGRKSMILVSEGFIYDPNMDEFKRVVQASRRSNVAIYFLDTRGLQGASIYATAQFGPSIDTQDIGASFTENIEASEGSESLSADSGGFTVKNTNDLAKGIKRIADETRSYYLLGYNPSNTARDGRFRKISVKVNGKNMDVRARKGYYAPLDGAKAALEKKKAGPDPAFQAALDSPFEEPAVPMRMTAHVFDETLLGKANVVLSADVDLSSFSFEEKEGRFVDTLEFLMVVAHRESGEYFRYDQKYDMKLLPATRDKLRTQWYPVSREFELAAGAYQAKLVVRDKNSNHIGTVIHNFDVPDLNQFRTSSLVLTDTLQTPKEGTGDDKRPKPALVARRTFNSAGMLYCQFDVFGMDKDKKTGMPIVSAGYIVRKKEGEVFTGVTPTKIQPTSLGRVSRMVGTKLEGAPPGEYELVLTVKDEVSGKAIQVAEEFTVVG